MGFGYGASADVSHNATAYKLATGERTGQVFTTDMAAHVWAQRSQTFGRSSKGVVYFHGRALFDYGAHYCAAYLTADDSAVLINGRSYSPTTSGHVGTAAYAALPRTRVWVPDLTGLLSGRLDSGDSYLNARQARYGAVKGTAEFESDCDAALANRAHVRAYCLAHVLTLAPESMEFLLARVGLKASAGKIRRDAEKARDKAKADAKRKEKRRAIETLKAFASAPDLPGYLIERRPSGYYYGNDFASDLARDVASDIRKARKAAGKASVSPAVWAKAWERLQSLDSIVPDIRAAWDRRTAKASRRSARQTLAYRLTEWREHKGHIQPGNDAHAYQHARAIVRNAESRATRAGNLASSIAALWPSRFAHVTAALYAAGEAFDSWADAALANPAMIGLADAYEADKAARELAEREWRERELVERLAAWRRGDDVGRVSASRESGAAYIRAVGVERDAAGAIIAGELQTSQGASVPLVQAVRAFRFLKLIRERGTGWQRNGARVRVGHFEVDSISATGDFVAGCHSFEWRDVRELAESLGVFELAPSADIVATREHA